MKIITALFILFALQIIDCSYSQVVTTNPTLFTVDDEVSIIFHAERGTGGLNGYDGEVYAHTGVITSGSSSGSDWKYVIAEWTENNDKAKLTKKGDNLWELKISPSIKEFYKLQDNVNVEKLAFVFRNKDGSKEGKDDGNKDIYVDVSQKGLALKILSPAHNSIYDANRSVNIDISASESQSLQLFIDDIEIKSGNSQTIAHSFSPTESKVYKIKAIATSDTKSVSDSVYIFVKGEIPEKFLAEKNKQGIQYLSENVVRLVLFAPKKEMIFVLGDFNNWKLSNEFIMNKDGDYFWLEINNLEKGKEYAFQYYIDNSIYIPDPYSEKILDPANDKSIPESTYPNLKSYPVFGARGLLSVLQTAQDEYEWENTNFVPAKNTDLVIYELLIRDFTQGPEGKEGNINGVLKNLDYFSDLHINAIEIMPFNEFEGNNSWGYNPALYFAPDKAYGTKNDYKKLIDSLHGRGIAVIMDIVFNHSYGQSPMVQMYFEDGKPAIENPWYNQTSPNTTYSWGYDFNHESLYTQFFIDSCLRYWVREYKIDGFRFDFTKGFTNRPGDGWAFDGSRINILRRMAAKIWEIDDDCILILEHLSENKEERALAEYGFLLWGNMNNNYAEAAMGYNQSGKSDLSWGTYTSRNWTNPRLITYMESHDEERIMYKTITWGNLKAEYNTKEPHTALNRQELIATFFFTIPGPKMVWQFGELGYDYNIDYNGRVGVKPVKWEYFNDIYRKRLYNVYAELIQLKIEEPAFETADFELDVKSQVKTITLKHTDMNVVAVGNFDVIEKEVDVAFPENGIWFEFFKHNSISVSNNMYSTKFNPGEYRLYMTKEFDKPEIGSIENWQMREFNYTINVIVDTNGNSSYIEVNSINPGYIDIDLYDLNGKLLKNISSNRYIFAGKNSISINNYKPGMYFIYSKLNNIVQTVKYIKY